MNLARSILSDANRSNRGKSLETLILASQSRATVLLTKIPLSARRLPGGKVLAVRGPVDFYGIHAPTHRAIIFDAKQSENLYQLPTGDSVLAEHQRLEICRYGEVGAIAGLLCEKTSSDTLLWCDWRLLTTRRPSIPWDEMETVGDSRLAVRWDKVVNAQVAAYARWVVRG